MNGGDVFCWLLIAACLAFTAWWPSRALRPPPPPPPEECPRCGRAMPSFVFAVHVRRCCMNDFIYDDAHDESVTVEIPKVAHHQ